MTEPSLKDACYEYYIAQQGLTRAEDEHLQLQAVKNQLIGQLRGAQDELNRLSAARDAVEKDRRLEAMLPHGVPAAAFDEYVEQEKKIFAEMTAADASLNGLNAEITNMRRLMKEEGQSATVLEESLNSQLKFNQVLTKSFHAGKQRLEEHNERLAAQSALKEHLDREIRKLQLSEGEIRSSVGCRATLKSRAQEQLRERDMDAVRLRKDAIFARRLYLSEVEHAREQDASLQELMTQNRRLKAMVAERRRGRPVLRQGRAATCDPAPPPFGVSVGRSPTFAPIELATNDPTLVTENDEPSAAFSKRGGGGNSSEKILLDKVRHNNLALLHQMVSSLQQLQLAVEKPPE